MRSFADSGGRRTGFRTEKPNTFRLALEWCSPCPDDFHKVAVLDIKAGGATFQREDPLPPGEMSMREIKKVLDSDTN